VAPYTLQLTEVFRFEVGSHDERLASSWAFPIVSNPDIVFAMSHVRRLRLGDRIFFVTVNLRRTLPPFKVDILEPWEKPTTKRTFVVVTGYLL